MWNKVIKGLAVRARYQLGCCLLSGLLAPGITQGDPVPEWVNYQGRLTDGSGKPLASGRYAVEYRIWSGASYAETNTLIWGARYSVDVVNGSFNVSLGGASEAEVKDPRDPSKEPQVTSISSAFGEPERFLGVTIATDGVQQPVPSAVEVAPRQQIVSAPYSIVSGDGVPIGGIVAWIPPQEVRTLEEAEQLLPAGFTLCRGGGKDKPESLFNEERIPNLLDARFLRGGLPDAVLMAGGSTNHTHSFSGVTGVATTGRVERIFNWTDDPPDSGDMHRHAVNGTIPPASHVPRHCSVLFVIRVH